MHIYNIDWYRGCCFITAPIRVIDMWEHAKSELDLLLQL
jgi:hypothetical protein